MLDRLAVILFRPKFSENVGSVARACVNMGCSQLLVVDPQEWDRERAAHLATSKGLALLDSIRFYPDLESALAPFSVVYGTTARTGGWRKGVLNPESTAPTIISDLESSLDVALVFGPEDRGLTNEQIDRCGQLLCIPTAMEATSLNLAQAVLIILYECFKLTKQGTAPAPGPPPSRAITLDEQDLLFDTMEQALVAIDFVKQDNLRYWMMPLRRFMQRMRLKRNEFNLLMGVCRQVKWKAGVWENEKLKARSSKLEARQNKPTKSDL